MTKLRSRGFTLIELLVVIAIIGVLSAVVLASLNTARDKGNDASIKSNLATVATQAELFYDSNGNKYATDTTTLASAACPTTGNTLFNADATIKQAIESARSSNGGAIGAVTRCAVGQNGQTYAIAVALKASGNFYCLDSRGIKKDTGSATAPALGGGGSAVAECP